MSRTSLPYSTPAIRWPAVRSSLSSLPAVGWSTVIVDGGVRDRRTRADGVERRRDRLPVGADQAAGAQLDAAVVPGHDRNGVGDLPSAEHFEHRDARGAGRFAVVVGPLLFSVDGPIRKAEQLCVASQCCLRIAAMNVRGLLRCFRLGPELHRKRERWISSSCEPSRAIDRMV